LDDLLIVPARLVESFLCLVVMTKSEVGPNQDGEDQARGAKDGQRAPVFDERHVIVDCANAENDTEEKKKPEYNSIKRWPGS